MLTRMLRQEHKTEAEADRGDNTETEERRNAKKARIAAFLEANKDPIHNRNSRSDKSTSERAQTGEPRTPKEKAATSALLDRLIASANADTCPPAAPHLPKGCYETETKNLIFAATQLLSLCLC